MLDIESSPFEAVQRMLLLRRREEDCSGRRLTLKQLRLSAAKNGGMNLG